MIPSSVFTKELYESLPDGWSEKRLKYVSNILPSNVDKKTYDDQKSVKLCNYVDVYYNDSIDNSLDYMISTASDQEIRKFTLKPGDVILTKDSESPDDIGIPSVVREYVDNLICGYHLSVLKPKQEIYGNFLFWFIYSRLSSSFFEKRANGITRYSIGVNTVGSLPVIFPSIESQKQISDFIDRETTRIDTLISKKQKQIELLQEKRQAIITQSVTKGLNENVKMKDSEVKWIGEIPEHWGSRKIRFVFSFGRGLGISKSDLIDEGIPCISYGEIHSKYGFEVDPEKHELKCVEEENLKSCKSSLLRYGDFIFADTSEDIEGSGNFTYLNSNQTVFAGYHTVIMRPKIKINSRFIAYLFDSPLHRSQVQQMVKGVKVYSITQSILKDVQVLLPPLEEQNLISSYLDSECIRIDNISDRIKKSVDLLKEYRSSLITHAVSGRIDISEEEVLK